MNYNKLDKNPLVRMLCLLAGLGILLYLWYDISQDSKRLANPRVELDGECAECDEEE